MTFVPKYVIIKAIYQRFISICVPGIYIDCTVSGIVIKLGFYFSIKMKMSDVKGLTLLI